MAFCPSFLGYTLFQKHDHHVGDDCADNHLISLCKNKGQTLAFFPEKFSKKYIIATCIVVAIYIAAPTNFSDGITSVMMILYSSIVTPVFEELLFRGYIWGRFEKVMTSEIHSYI